MRHITEAYISSLLERRKILRFPLIIVMAVILLSWLYYKSEAISSLEHIKYSNLLGNIQDENAKIDSEILAARLELSRNYDSIATHTIKLEDTFKQVTQIPKFLFDDDAKNVQLQLDLLMVVLTNKSQKTDLFKRQNAILRNSLAYFQTIADSTLELQEISSIKEPLEHYIRHLFFISERLHPKQNKTWPIFRKYFYPRLNRCQNTKKLNYYYAMEMSSLSISP